MSEKSKWDHPEGVISSPLDAAGELARKHGISPDRAQMLVDRLGHDSNQLEQAAEALRINPKVGKSKD